MFYLQVPDINVSIVNIEDSAIARLGFFTTYSRLSDNPRNIEYLRNSSLLDYVGFLCLRFDIRRIFFIIKNILCILIYNNLLMN